VSEFDTRRWVGRSVRRLEDPRLLRGEGRYVADLVPEGALVVAFVRSQVAHGLLRRIDSTAAAAMAGVAAVYTWDDLASTVLPPVAESSAEGYSSCPYHPLADGTVRWVGEPVAAVVAESRAVAADAAELVEVHVEEWPALTTLEAALAADAPQLHATVPGNVYNRFSVADRGSVAEELAAAEHRMQMRFRSQRVAPVPLEPRGIVAEYRAGDGELTVWVSHQAPHLFRTGLARFLAMAESSIRVISPDVGGGFGAKLIVYPEDLVVCEAARRLGRPVSWTSERREDLVSSMQGREQRVDLTVAYDGDGTIRAVGAEITADNGANAPWPYTAALDSGQASENVTGPYDVAAYERRVAAVATNKPPMGPYRGVGRVMACFAMERAIDEIAADLGAEPLDVRAANVVRDYPFTTPTGLRFASGSSAESIDLLRRHFDLAAMRRRHAEARAAGDYVGVGFAAAVEHNSLGPEEVARKGIDIGLGYESAAVRVEPDGAVVVQAGSHSHGQGHETALAQLTADALGIEVTAVTVRCGDTAIAPYGFGTWASRSMVCAGGAVLQAAGDVRRGAVRVAAVALEAAEEDCIYSDGGVSVRGAPRSRLTLAEIGQIAYHEAQRLPAHLDPGLGATRRYRAPDPGSFTNALHGAEVRVDTATGLVEILRYAVVEDCGTIINPMLVDGQIHGGVAQGIGQALFEELRYDDAGQPLVTTLVDYLVPSAAEVPNIETLHIESPSPLTLGGVKGMGEGGAINSPAAIANAVADALRPLGVRIDCTPISPEWLVAAIARARSGAAAEGRDS